VVSASPDEREFLERSLADLERERAAGDLAEDDYADLKARYEAKLAAAAAAVPATTEEPARTRRWRPLVVTLAVVLVIGVGGGLAVARWSGARKPGETVTGTVPSTSAQQLAQAATLAGDGKVLEALKIYDKVLAENPKDVRALTYKGWLLRNVGVENGETQLAAQGVSYIEQATSIDPTFSEAWFFRGIIYFRDENDTEKATQALKLALANDPIPEVATAARGLLAQIQKPAP
jgi:cytochrome c-type biogenesis protein CcmI